MHRYVCHPMQDQISSRRLVEAGCSFVTCVMENPFVSGVKSPKLGFYNWDSHAVNCDLWVDARAKRSLGSESLEKNSVSRLLKIEWVAPYLGPSARSRHVSAYQ